MPTSRHSFVALAVALTLTATACGDSTDGSADPAAVTAQANDEFNTDDVMFAQGMIPHHSQAVEMASLALDPARIVSDEVRDLAGRIQSAQDPEIEQMTEWLNTWGEPQDMPAMDGMDMDGMVASDDVEALDALDGAAFDAEWIRLMIAHHEGAIAMANDQINNGLNAEVVTLAKNIVAAQQAEIDEMR